MNVVNSPSLDSRLRQWRHDLHQTPELAFEEHDTNSYVAQVLHSLKGVEVADGFGGTGVVGSLTLGDGAGVIGLRADMDCLPLHESATHDYPSRNNGRMHACGHDGHMAMVLGAAAVLAEEGGFKGTVRFVFQPAEEPGRGAQAMLDSGLLERFPLDAIYGLHNMPGFPSGNLYTREGAIMAGEDNFVIRITGRGGHASMPDLVVDPLVIGAEIVLALQTVVARSIPPTEPAVVSCTELVTDGARNAIPTEVVIKGDTRSFTDETRQLIERRIREITEGICSSYGAKSEVTYTHEFEPTVNDAESVRAAVDAAITVVGESKVDSECAQLMGSEDFGVFAREVPGCFTFIGNGTESGRGGTPLHNNTYDFNDDILEIGVQYYVELVRSILQQEQSSGPTPA
jgi:amidohydrolase